MGDQEVAISVQGVSKSFRLPHERHGSIKNFLFSALKGRRRTFEKQKVLEDISFDIKKGEFFGIVGRNGSGKSTLLKLLAGIYSPDKGHIRINGKLTPFIELGVGFNMELTGRENVFLNGALLGFSRMEMEGMYKDIVEFAELEKFMDQKLKNYSSGMQVRLAFSIAIRANNEILVLDEVLAVGDTAFQKKCFEYFVLLRREKRTVVLVTHDMSAVEKFCDKALVLSDGEILGEFKPSEAASEYERLNASSEAGSVVGKKRWGTRQATIEDISFSGYKSQDGKVPVFEMGKPFKLSIDLRNPNKKDITIGLAVEDVYGVNISGPNSSGTKLISPTKIHYSVNKLPLLPGEYKLTVAIFDEDLVEEFDHMEKTFTFRVTAKEHGLYGKVSLFGSWENGS